MFTLDYITKKIYNFVNIFIIKTIIDILGDFIKKLKEKNHGRNRI